MAGRSSSKWHTERARREKLAAKRERKDLRATQTDDAPAAGAPVDQAQVLEALAALHARYDDGGLSLDDFEEAKQGLIEQLRVD